MSSLISVLTLCILVLSNGCFTLPVVNEQIPSSTYTPINDDVTTGETINLRLVADDDKTILPNIESLRSIDEHIGFEMTTSSVNLSGNKFIKALRAFDEYSTPESMITTTGESNPDKREFDDLPFATVEPIVEADEVDRRSIVNEFENGTQIMPVETTTTVTINTTLPLTSTTVVPEITTSEPFTLTTVVPEITTPEPLTSTTVVPKITTPEPFTSTIGVPEITTSEPFTSTSSSSSTSSSTSTEKYIGHLKDENKYDEEYEPSTKSTKIPRKSGVSTTMKSKINLEDEPEEYEPSTKSLKIPRKSGVSSTMKTKINLEDEPEEYEPSTKSTKIQRKSGVSTTTKPKINLEDESEEYEPSTKSMKFQRKSGVSTTKKSKINLDDKSEEKEEYSKESTVPTAVFDQQALDKVSNVPNDFLVLDENNDLVVTGLPNRTFTTSKANKNEEEAKPLNQGEESAHSEEKESHN